MPAPNRTCPTTEDLRAFGLGSRLDEATAGYVARHVETCEACTEALAAVTTDGFLDRRWAANVQDGTPVPPGPLSGLARSITREHAAGPDPTSATGEVAPELGNSPDYEVIRELGRGGWGWSTWRGTA